MLDNSKYRKLLNIFTMKKFIIPVFLCFLWVQSAIGNETTTINFYDGPVFGAKEKANIEGKIYFLDFTASWCLPCKILDETISEPTLAKYINENTVPVKIDIEDFDGMILRETHKVQTLPTVIFFNAKGKEIARIEENVTSTQFLNILKSINSVSNREDTSQSWNKPIIKSAPKKPEIPTNRNSNNQNISYDKEPQRQFQQNAFAANDLELINPVNTNSFPETIESKGTPLSFENKRPIGNYTIQLGAYSTQNNAQNAMDSFQFETYFKAYNQPNGNTIYKVYTGKYSTMKEARKNLSMFRTYNKNAFAKKL